jgi:bifunctional oligoribonuclease and PAP phosphatase NrnA
MFAKFRKEIVRYDCVGVFSHLRPDGDCIGSQVAFSRWLEVNGVRALAFNDHDLQPNLRWLSDFHPIEKPDSEITAQCDAFVVLDGNAPDRFGTYEEYQDQFPRPSYMIDHHPDPVDSFNMILSDDTASSTCELIYRLFIEHDPDQIDGEIARALYAGILTDTGSLQFDSVTPETVEAVADLLRRGGFRPNEVVERVFSNKSPRQLKLLGLALDSIQLFENNQIAIMSVTSEMLKATGTTNEDCDGFVSYPLSIAGVKAAILMKDLDGKGIKMSLRSRSDLNVNEWARELDGGGHKKAAGAWHPGPLETAVHDVVKIGVKLLNRIENQKITP